MLAKQQAKDAGAYEAWLVDADGFVTEGSSSNAWIVDGGGVLVTHRRLAILSGVTAPAVPDRRRQGSHRRAAFCARRSFPGREAFISGATTIVLPWSIDGQNIGSGAPGPPLWPCARLFTFTAATP